MNKLAETARDLLLDILQTAFRLLPWSTEPGLRRIGKPDRSSPVLVTCNYDLTVRRVARAMLGHDAWLVVAPSRGINVWCASSGGHLTTHQVVTALKTSGVADEVDQKRAVLPQLAATGVIGRDVARRCGWKVRFGPVYAADLPAYLAAGGEKTDAMRRVRFDLSERLEMAASWAVPGSIVLGVAMALWRPAFVAPIVGLAFALAGAVFLVYDRIPGPRRLVLGAVATAVSVATVAAAAGSTTAMVTAAAASLLLTALLTVDYPGTTPVEGGSHFEEREWKIVLDPGLCDGVYSCFEVCPAACFEKDDSARKAVHAHPARCIHCGACIVQCPKDALCFEDAASRRIEPDVIRRFKLNLMGRREVDAA